MPRADVAELLGHFSPVPQEFRNKQIGIRCAMSVAEPGLRLQV
jgi:hypothetical protein